MYHYQSWYRCSPWQPQAALRHIQPFYSSQDFVRDNPDEPVPEETFIQSHLSWSSIIPYLLHLILSIASSVFNFHAWQSFSTISLQVFFGLPLSLAPSTSYSILFFTQSLSSFCSTCPYNRNLFCCSTKIMSSNSSLSLNPLLGTLMLVGYKGMRLSAWPLMRPPMTALMRHYTCHSWKLLFSI